MSERHRHGFMYYISEPAIKLAGFNYWEPDLYINTFNGLANVLLGRIENRHLVVIKDVRMDKNRHRTDWYLGVLDLSEGFVSPPIDEIEKLVSRKNRVAGKNLNQKILNAAEEIWDPE